MSEPLPENPTPISVPSVSPTPTPPATSPVIPPSTGGKSSKKGLMVVGLIAILSLTLLGGLFFFLQGQKTEPDVTQTTPTPTPTVEIKTLVMEVDSLSDHQVVSTKVLKISGKTNVQAMVTITGGSEDTVVESTGIFTTEVTLNPGDNVLTFTAVDSEENQKVLVLNILFTDEVLQ